ncbi:MAG: 30S ribosome-binding factor RbfA [Cytophagaceae bacterium]|nr:30S ribosome-binding factor RbfA [Cytophagaceae bacterium]
MDSTRQLKYARLIQKELGEIFQRDAKDLFEGAFVTLTKVTVSPDLSIAKVYMSFLLVKDKGEMIKKVTTQGKVIKKLLGERIRKQARVIPDLHFHLDDNLDYAAKMEDIFSKISKPKEEDKDDKEDTK